MMIVNDSWAKIRAQIMSSSPTDGLYIYGKFPIWDFFRGSYSMLALEAQNIPIWVDSDISDAFIV